MTSPTMLEVVNGIKTRVETIPDLAGRVAAFVPGTMDPPSVTIVPGTFVPGNTKAAVTYHRTMGPNGSASYVFTLAVAVSRVVEEQAAIQLDGYLSAVGPTSIKQAIDDDITLGGISGYCDVVSVIQYGALTWNGVDFFGAQISVEVQV